MIISDTYRPAPKRLHSVRNGALVTPAIGASTTGGQTGEAADRERRELAAAAPAARRD